MIRLNSFLGVTVPHRQDQGPVCSSGEDNQGHHHGGQEDGGYHPDTRLFCRWRNSRSHHHGPELQSFQVIIVQTLFVLQVKKQKLLCSQPTILFTTVRTSRDYKGEYLNTWVEYKNFYDELCWVNDITKTCTHKHEYNGASYSCLWVQRDIVLILIILNTNLITIYFSRPHWHSLLINIQTLVWFSLPHSTSCIHRN